MGHSVMDLVWDLEAGIGNVRLMVAANGHNEAYGNQLDNLRLITAELRRLVQGSTGRYPRLERPKPDTVEIEEIDPDETNPGR